MLCITEIKVVNVERDFINIQKRKGAPTLARVINSDPVEYAEVKTEHIHGRVFVNERREEICIGISKQAQGLIGLPFGVFESMRSEAACYRIRLQQQADKIEYLELPWWKKLYMKYTDWNQYPED